MKRLINKSAKRRIKASYPNAYAHSWADCWTIYTGAFVNQALGNGKTPALAWKAALRKAIV